MDSPFKKTVLATFVFIALITGSSFAQMSGFDSVNFDSEANPIQQMAAGKNIEGLIKMLSDGNLNMKVAAAEYLAEIGDERALPELGRLNTENGGWSIMDTRGSGAFAVAICRILTRNKSEKDQIEALFELLGGEGPAVPQSVELGVSFIINGEAPDDEMNELLRKDICSRNVDVGKRVAIELVKFNDPTIIERLRKCENRGASPYAVWMEVRYMDMQTAIKRCQQIARDEGGEQGYGAIHCLGNCGPDAIEALNQLALEGFDEAITVLGDSKEDEKVFDMLCWHFTNNKNSLVRRQAMSQVALIESDSLRQKSLQSLVQALYDPSEIIRERAAFYLSIRASKRNKVDFDKIEDSLLIALKHPDIKVREYVLKSLERLGCEGLNEQVPDPPSFRTDLEERSRPPLTTEQKLTAKTEPLEQEAKKAMENGPVEKAVTLYTELLELRPGYEPYEKSLEKTRNYVKAAEAATEIWYPDSPYIGVKGRYSYYLASKPEDISTLKEEFELAQYLATTHFSGWTNPFGDDPKGKDHNVKALKLYEHIANYYPANEYLVIRSKGQIGGLKRNLEFEIKTLIDMYAIPTESIVDSSDVRRNIPLEEHGGKTQAQVDFEKYYKDMSRDRLIDICNMSDQQDDFLDEIIERCSLTDPKIVEKAKAAKR